VKFGYAGARTGSLRIFGGTWTTQIETVEIDVLPECGLCWETDIEFAVDPGLEMPFQGVLGSRGFLDRLAVTFNQYNNYFVIEKSDDFHERVGQHLINDPTDRADSRWLRGK